MRNYCVINFLGLATVSCCSKKSGQKTYLKRKEMLDEIFGYSCSACLKVPKRENFSLAFFAQTKPIWVCDLENKIEKIFFGV
jgi:hypothetical protein